MAALAPEVFATAKKRDRIARDILEGAAGMLATLPPPAKGGPQRPAATPAQPVSSERASAVACRTRCVRKGVGFMS